MAITSLPENPNVSVSTLGKDYLLSVNTGTVAVSKWVPVAGQRNTTMNRSAEEIDCSDKTSGGRDRQCRRVRLCVRRRYNSACFWCYR